MSCTSDPEIRGGTLVLKGTRFPVSRVLAEVGDGSTLEEIADLYRLDLTQLKTLFEELALYFEEPNR